MRFSATAALTAVVPVVTTAVRAATSWSNRRLAQLEAAEASIRESIERNVAEKEKRVEEAERKLDGVREQLTAERTRQDALNQRTAALRLRIAHLTPARVFVEFADERSSDYRRRLGLLSKVRQDLLAIQSQLRDNNARFLDSAVGAPDVRLPNRIVLYIDDLDRCPPDKVVEVLEAVAGRGDRADAGAAALTDADPGGADRPAPHALHRLDSGPPQQRVALLGDLAAPHGGV